MPDIIAQNGLEMIEYRDMPSILVLADSDAAIERARRSAERAGCRVCGVAGIGEAAERLDRQVAMDAVLVELDGDHGAPLDRLLDRLDAAARAERHGSVVSAPAALIDAVAARTTHGRVLHLCGPSEAERVAAVAIAAAHQPARLHDVSKDPGHGRLQQLSEEVGRIATILANLSEEERGEVAVRPPEESGGGREIGAGQIRAIIRARRLRDHYFSALFFADPAWDMLLDLMAARLEARKVAVSSLCIAAAVPPTTALRWIKTLSDHGLFVRSADPEDGRRVYITLSETAAAGMAAYLAAALRISPIAL